MARKSVKRKLSNKPIRYPKGWPARTKALYPKGWPGNMRAVLYLNRRNKDNNDGN